MKKIVSLLVVLVLAVTCFTACSTSAPAEESSAPAESSAAESSAPAESAAASDDSAASEAPAESEAASDDSTASASSGAGSAKDKANEDLTIVMVAKHEGITWFDDMRIGVNQFAEDTGVNAYQIAPEGGDPAKQNQMVEDLIAQGVDAICVVPNDTQAMIPVLDKAREAGIVVISHEAPDLLDHVDYDMEAIDNLAHGTNFGIELAEAMGGEGKYASMVGMLTMTPHMEWWEGCVNYLKENHPDMECISAEPEEDVNDNQVAYDKALEILKANPDVKGFTDSAASGAGIAQALQERGRDDIALVSTAVPSQAGTYVEDGYMDAGLCWRPADAGWVTCDIALKVLKGEPIENGMGFDRPGYEEVEVMGNAIVANAPIIFKKDNLHDEEVYF